MTTKTKCRHAECKSHPMHPILWVSEPVTDAASRRAAYSARRVEAARLRSDGMTVVASQTPGEVVRLALRDESKLGGCRRATTVEQ